jgi:threonyl-tRNA synthetase
MRVLYIHAKSFTYRPREKVKIETVEDAETIERSFENALVAFITVEEGDFKRRQEIIDRFVDDVIDVRNRLNADIIILYPYAHLSNTLEKPPIAIRMLRLIERNLANREINLHRAPFGWYKEFMIHCLGHPLAELSRNF